ncbi:MAG TPA: ATP-binding protein [Candidatus Binatia bacterium]|nr:ATP-binding protein [Candidatus Binatia bacterium]
MAIGLLAVVLAARTTLTSRSWIGRVFPGFMVLDNRVVASVGLGHWSGSSVDRLYQSEILAVDGVPVASATDVYTRVGQRPPETSVAYDVRHGNARRVVAIPTQRFTASDWLLLFGAFLVSGTAYLACGLAVWMLRPRAPVSRAVLGLGIAWGVFMLTAMDLYGPATFFRLHVLCEAAVPPTLFQLTLLFPQPHRYAHWRFVGYLPALAIAVLYQMFLYQPAAYSWILTVNMGYLGAVGVFFGGRLVLSYVRDTSELARQRVRIAALGALCGFMLPASFVFASFASGGGMAINLGVFPPILFVVSIAYAVVKHDLFEIDAMVKRGAYYLFLTGAVAVGYIGAVALLNFGMEAGAVTGSALFPVVFALAVLLVVHPLRTRLQTFVDRVFFRTSYEPARVLAALGRELAASQTRDHVARVVEDGVARTIPNTRTRFFVLDRTERLSEVGGSGFVPAALATRLSDGRLVTAFDSSELYPDAGGHDAVRADLAANDAEVAVPLLLRGDLLGVLTVGRKRSGLFYTAGDAEFLQALAHQAAIALANARSYEALIELNARLEERVRERTSQLEHANRELADAYTELKNAESQLVHSEKMASLGRLVAGVAHEINNPVSFISTSVTPLRRRLAQAVAIAPPTVRPALEEADDIAGIMARGAERTAAIVRDLRTFSRLGEATRKATDLHEGLEVTLRLLEARWRGRVEVHREFGDLPSIEADPGQLNQVFMNVLANACDAMPDRGNLWITTRVEDGAAVVTIRDDGPGIPPETIGRIFDPFFTTKDVGGGTGLGLAISHGIVTAHGGRIDVESPPGSGATFRIVLPLVTAPPARAARTA